jgi:hypothetical protein
MINNLAFFTLSFFTLIFVFYDWILVEFLLSKKQLFKYKITSKWRIFSFLALFFLVLLYVLITIKLRFSRIGFTYNISELYYLLEEYANIVYNEYTLSYNTAYLLFYPLLLLSLGISIMVFWVLLAATVVKILRLSIIAVYIYLLQFPRFNKVNRLLFWFIFGIRRFILANFESYSFELRLELNKIWRTLPVKLEYGIYRSLPIFLIYLDILLNNYTPILFFGIMPWYYIYSITRKLIVFLKSLVLDVEFQQLSLDMYPKKSNYKYAI